METRMEIILKCLYFLNFYQINLFIELKEVNGLSTRYNA